MYNFNFHEIVLFVEIYMGTKAYKMEEGRKAVVISEEHHLIYKYLEERITKEQFDEGYKDTDSSLTIIAYGINNAGLGLSSEVTVKELELIIESELISYIQHNLSIPRMYLDMDIMRSAMIGYYRNIARKHGIRDNLEHTAYNTMINKFKESVQFTDMADQYYIKAKQSTISSSLKGFINMSFGFYLGKGNIEFVNVIADSSYEYRGDVGRGLGKSKWKNKNFDYQRAHKIISTFDEKYLSTSTGFYGSSLDIYQNLKFEKYSEILDGILPGRGKVEIKKREVSMQTYRINRRLKIEKLFKCTHDNLPELDFSNIFLFYVKFREKDIGLNGKKAKDGNGVIPNPSDTTSVLNTIKDFIEVYYTLYTLEKQLEYEGFNLFMVPKQALDSSKETFELSIKYQEEYYKKAYMEFETILEPKVVSTFYSILKRETVSSLMNKFAPKEGLATYLDKFKLHSFRYVANDIVIQSEKTKEGKYRDYFSNIPENDNYILKVLLQLRASYLEEDKIIRASTFWKSKKDLKVSDSIDYYYRNNEKARIIINFIGSEMYLPHIDLYGDFHRKDSIRYRISLGKQNLGLSEGLVAPNYKKYISNTDILNAIYGDMELMEEMKKINTDYFMNAMNVIKPLEDESKYMEVLYRNSEIKILIFKLVKKLKNLALSSTDMDYILELKDFNKFDELFYDNNSLAKEDYIWMFNWVGYLYPKNIKGVPKKFQKWDEDEDAKKGLSNIIVEDNGLIFREDKFTKEYLAAVKSVLMNFFLVNKENYEILRSKYSDFVENKTDEYKLGRIKVVEGGLVFKLISNNITSISSLVNRVVSETNIIERIRKVSDKYFEWSAGIESYKNILIRENGYYHRRLNSLDAKVKIAVPLRIGVEVILNFDKDNVLIDPVPEQIEEGVQFNFISNSIYKRYTEEV